MIAAALLPRMVRRNHINAQSQVMGMELHVYIFHPDNSSSHVDTVADLDDAVALCRELVAVDGHPRAEVWSELGDRLYGMELTSGALHSYDDGDAYAPPPPMLMPPPSGRERDRRRARRASTPRPAQARLAGHPLPDDRGGANGNDQSRIAEPSLDGSVVVQPLDILDDAGAPPGKWLGL